VFVSVLKRKDFVLKNASVYFEAQTRCIKTQQVKFGAEFKIG